MVYRLTELKFLNFGFFVFQVTVLAVFTSDLLFKLQCCVLPESDTALRMISAILNHYRP